MDTSWLCEFPRITNGYKNWEHPSSGAVTEQVR